MLHLRAPTLGLFRPGNALFTTMDSLLALKLLGFEVGVREWEAQNMLTPLNTDQQPHHRPVLKFLSVSVSTIILDGGTWEPSGCGLPVEGREGR